MPHCAALLQPLNVLLVGTKKHTKTLPWNHPATLALANVKEAIAKATLLVHPELEAPTCIMTDALETAVEAVLQQRIANQWQPLAYFSRALKPAQTRYSAFDREQLAIYLAVKHFCYFIEGHQFFIQTDHNPLMYARLKA